ncbi:MAG: hypothetical protein KH168_05375 [Clostridiaceae bacterium]|nr:hypothetical protein [Clostridiaceae bacterium]
MFQTVKREWNRWRIRRNYKDHLFIRLFHEKSVLLELYNALNGTDYQNSDDLIITTIDDAVYMGMKNDCSFIVGHDINLYEHQSSYCPNMPLRGMIYLADVYKSLIEADNLNVYGSAQIKLPTPKYIVFYNGTSERAEREELRISDAFETDDGCLEFTATMININKGNNQELMEKCRTLKEYSLFIDKVREYQKSGLGMAQAVDDACVYCIQHDILREFLIKNRNEVRRVFLTEFDAKKQRELDRRDAREEGREEGRQEGRQESQIVLLIKKIKKGQNLEQIADALETSPEELKEMYEAVIAAAPEYDVKKIYQMLVKQRKV